MELLPSSKLRQPKNVQLHKHMNWEPIFCANCGADGGFVPHGTSNYAFWLCDNCWETHGQVAGTMAVPDEEFWKKEL